MNGLLIIKVNDSLAYDSMGSFEFVCILHFMMKIMGIIDILLSMFKARSSRYSECYEFSYIEELVKKQQSFLL